MRFESDGGGVVVIVEPALTSELYSALCAELEEGSALLARLEAETDCIFQEQVRVFKAARRLHAALVALREKAPEIRAEQARRDKEDPCQCSTCRFDREERARQDQEDPCQCSTCRSDRERLGRVS